MAHTFKQHGVVARIGDSPRREIEEGYGLLRAWMVKAK